MGSVIQPIIYFIILIAVSAVSGILGALVGLGGERSLCPFILYT
jgi:hypothetical protein